MARERLPRKGAFIFSFRDRPQHDVCSRAVGVALRYGPYAFVSCEAGCEIPNDRVQMAIWRVAARTPLVAGMHRDQPTAPRPAFSKVVLVGRRRQPIAADDMDAVVIKAGQIKIRAFLVDQIRRHAANRLREDCRHARRVSLGMPFGKSIGTVVQTPIHSLRSYREPKAAYGRTENSFRIPDVRGTADVTANAPDELSMRVEG